MKLDARTLHLIHGEIDGTIDAEQRAELTRLVENDPAVRHERDGLCALQQTLSGLEPLEPPVGLKTAIMAGVAEVERSAGGAGRRRAFERWFDGLAGSTGLRATAMAAAALVVVVLAWPFISDRQPVDPAAALGTIGAVQPAAPADGASEPHPDEIIGAGLMFDAADGEVLIAPLGGGRYRAELVIDARQPMQVEIVLGGAELIGAEPVEGPADALRREGDRLIWTVARRSGIRLTLANAQTVQMELHGTRAGAFIGSATIPVGPR